MGVQENGEQPSIQARLQLVRSITRALNSANNSIALYPPDSPMPLEAAGGFVAALDRFLMFEPYLQLSVGADRLCLEDEDVCGTAGTVRRLAFHLHTRQVGQVRFMSGLHAQETVTFLRILALDPELLRSKGGLGRALVAGGVSHIQVVDLAQEAAAASAGEVSPDAMRVAGVAGLAQAALVARDPAEAKEWLRQAVSEVGSHGLTVDQANAELARVLAVEADKAVSFSGADREIGLDNLSQAITSLDETSRRGLIASLMSCATAAAALGALLSRINEGELVSALAEAATTSGANPAQLIAGSSLDAVRKDRIAGRASAMVQTHAKPAVEQPVVPAPRPAPRVQVDSSLPRFSRQSDNVPFSATRLAADVREFSQQERDSLLAAPQEAQAPEVDKPMVTLLYLLGRTRDEKVASETVDSIVETARYSLSLGRISTLTRGICGMRVVAERADPTAAIAHKLDDAIKSLSAGDVAAQVVQLLGAEDGAARTAGATAYFSSAQPSAQEAALDVLATDVSKELKGRVQAVLRDMGPRVIGTLERHVLDRRWQVAHSSVVILGGIGEPRLAPALRRALGHSEPRVVDAAMRALAAIGGDEAEAAIVSVVSQNEGAARMLAIELAGRMRAVSSVPALAGILSIGDMFGRTLEEKVAVVDALGGIGTPEALQALAGAVCVRFFFSPGKTAILRDRARGAIARASAASSSGPPASPGPSAGSPGLQDSPGGGAP